MSVSAKGYSDTSGRFRKYHGQQDWTNHKAMNLPYPLGRFWFNLSILEKDTGNQREKRLEPSECKPNVRTDKGDKEQIEVRVEELDYGRM